MSITSSIGVLQIGQFFTLLTHFIQVTLCLHGDIRQSFSFIQQIQHLESPTLEGD